MDEIVTRPSGPAASVDHRARLRALEDKDPRAHLPFDTPYGALVHAASSRAEEPAYRFLRYGSPDEPPEDWTFATVLDHVTRLAGRLRELGIKETSAVGLFLPNMPQALMALHGAMAAGIALPVNHLLEPSAIAGICTRAEVRMLIGPGADVDFDTSLKMRAVAALMDPAPQLIEFGDFPPGRDALSMTSLIEHGPKYLPFDAPAADRDMLYVHTGGTTGLPKLVRHTGWTQIFGGWSLGSAMEAPGETIVPNGFPLFHTAGIVVAHRALIRARPLLLLTAEGFRNPRAAHFFWHQVARFNITSMNAVPTMARLLMQAPRDGLDISSFTRFGFGGAPIPPALLKRMEEELGIDLVDCWGQTEIGGFGTANLPPAKPGSQGVIGSYRRMRTVLLDAEGGFLRNCVARETGVLLIRGEALTPGYTDRAKNRDLFMEVPGEDGEAEIWLNTGDTALIDEDGYLFLRGRARDLIIRGGHNIDPGMIEEPLNGHPSVAEAVAVGQPDAHAGEVPVAFVLLQQGETAVSQSDLLAYARAHVPERAAIPKRLIVKSAMPQTDIGKTDRKALRAEAARFVLETALQDALSEGEFDLTVAADADHGIRATLRLFEPSRLSAARSVMDSYSVAYDIEIAAEA